MSGLDPDVSAAGLLARLVVVAAPTAFFLTDSIPFMAAVFDLEAEHGLRVHVGEVSAEYPTAAACLADLPALTVHLSYPLRLKKWPRSTNLLERSLEEVRRRTKAIGRFPGETTSCLTMASAVMDLVIAGSRGLGLTLPERHQIAALIAARAVPQTARQIA